MAFNINDYLGKGTFLGDFGSFLGSDAGKGIINTAGLGLAGWGAYNQNKQLNKQNNMIAQNNAFNQDMALKTYNYNKALNDREIAKENLAQENMIGGFGNSFGTSTKPKNLSSYYDLNNYGA